MTVFSVRNSSTNGHVTLLLQVVTGRLFTGSYDGSVKVWDTSGINDDTAFGKPRVTSL